MRQPNTSGGGQQTSRPQVIRDHVERALARRGILFKVYVEKVAQLHIQNVPEHIRETKAFDMDTVKGLQAAQKRISRLVHVPFDEKPQIIPVELEEALVLALPEPERTECLSILCERFGVIPVHQSEVKQGKEIADLGAFVRETGEAIHQLSKAMSAVGFENMPIVDLARARKELMDVVETAMCLTKQIDQVTSGNQ